MTGGVGKRPRKALPPAVDGGTRPRRRAKDGRSWTPAKERAFLAALAASCNVKYAAGEAGVSVSNIYVRRGKDAAFRRGWDKALAQGYAALELEMLKRALHGVEKTITARDGSTTTVTEYSDRVGLALLRMHRDTVVEAESEIADAEADEARERIIAKLERLRERELGAGTVEVKSSARNRAVAVITWWSARR